MANWYGTALSNRFTVKDYEAFSADIEHLPLDVHQENCDPNNLTIFAATEDGAFPTDYYDDESGEYLEADLMGIIQDHITDDSCAILMEVGNEKLRYVTGWACAISSKEINYVNLDDIYDVADKMMGRTVR